MAEVQIPYLSKAGATLIVSKTKTALAGKVDKEDGKGLSSNDYTSTEKNKLNGISNGAQVNVIESVKVNGTPLTVSSKSVNIDLSGKVDKESGKVLSSNDYTSTEKTKLSGIATGAQVNVIESVKVNGTTLTPSSKAVDISVPTKVSQITNDSGFQTAAQVTTAINNAVGAKFHLTPTKVDSLPGTGEEGKLYIVPNSGTGKNLCKEYIWVDGAFEEIGAPSVDLTGYAKTADFVEVTTAEINAMWA